MKCRHQRGLLQKLLWVVAPAFAFVGGVAAAPIQNPQTLASSTLENNPATRQHPITFSDILSVYALTNVASNRHQVLSMYLRS